MTSARIEMLTPTEAAVVSCVAVRDVNRVIDEKILPKGLYKVGRDRTRWFDVDACAFISFYFKAANQLTSEERMRIDCRCERAIARRGRERSGEGMDHPPRVPDN